MLRSFKPVLLFWVLIALVSDITAQDWQSLMPYDNQLNGWTKKGGDATFILENGEIIGQCNDRKNNTFLCTKKDYQDFILELEIFVDPTLNSGVQIRSHSLPEYNNGRVHGWQVEVDPSDRNFTGGIYDEARRMWLYPVSLNPPALHAFKNGQWNHIRIEAIGNRVKTWINGIATANLVDNRTETGFIALQAHATYSDDDVGKIVKWRNVRILTRELAKYAQATSAPEQSYLINELTDNEKRKGWRLLWDGKTSKGWRAAKAETFPAKGWEMKDGVLTVQATDGGESTGPGDIITEDLFDNFELELEFMITEGANSGIKYFVDPELNKGPGSAIGCEFQLLDDAKHPDAKMGVNGNRTLASLYDLITAENYSAKGRSKQFKGIGEWNKATIISRNGKVEHWLNNEKVLEYDRFSQMFRALVAYSKYAQWPEFGQWPSGHILLQDHGNQVSFRSIKIREF